MNKPGGKFRCLACGKEWDGSALYLDPRSTAGRWTCGDLFCGGTVVDAVHSLDADTQLALCGSIWFHASGSLSGVTCTECLAILEQREAQTAVTQEVDYE